jgi:hypothetical protein
MPTFLQPFQQSLFQKAHLLLVTLLLGEGLWCQAAQTETAKSSRRPLGETLQEWERQVAAVRDAHTSTLNVLETASDLPAGFRGLRKDLDTLSKRLPVATSLEKLTEDARNIAQQISYHLPSGRVEAETASALDREVQATLRRATSLKAEISALQKELQETRAQLEKWQNAYHAFDFDPQRQEHIVRRLVSGRRDSLTEEIRLPLIPLEPENAPPLTAPQIQVSAPAAKPLLVTTETEDSPPSQQEQIRHPIPIAPPTAISAEDVLASLLETAVTRPEDSSAQAALNAACFSHLEQFGPQLLSSPFNAKESLSEHLLAHLESAARNKSQAAQQLLGMMHLTGRGRGLNYPRGVAYLRAASTQLKTKPTEPYGPGVTPEQCASSLPNVGTALFWLAESLLLGLMEQQPEAAADCYKQAVTLGDPLAHIRIRQLTATAATTSRQIMKPKLIGLVELHQVDLNDLESQLVMAQSIALEKKTPELPGTLQPSEETLRPFTGLKLASPEDTGLGALITSVLPASPAHQAGLRRGDLIVAVNTQSTASPESFQRIIEQTPAGEHLELRFLRAGGTAAETRLLLGTITAVTDDVFAVLDPIPLQASWNPSGVGFQIFSIKPGSSPAEAGLRPGDIVIGANDRYVRHWNDFAAALNPPQGMTTLIVQRHSSQGQPELLSVELLRR